MTVKLIIYVKEDCIFCHKLLEAIGYIDFKDHVQIIICNGENEVTPKMIKIKGNKILGTKIGFPEKKDLLAFIGEDNVN